MCSVTLRRRNYTRQFGHAAFEEGAGGAGYGGGGLMETAALTALDSVALAVLETVIAVLTEVRMAAIRNFISEGGDMDDILKNLFGGRLRRRKQFWKGWFRTRIWRGGFWSLWL